jgi:transcription elongation factor Elf1
MKIKEITFQNRRDFQAIFICDGCGHEFLGSGYDDANFHQNVIPSKICPKCGKTEKEIDPNYRPLTTKYPEWQEV